MPVIEVCDLVKVYGKIKAVDGLSFKIQKGEILSLVGPNGAGKTTTIKILSGIVPPTSGAAYMGGVPVGNPQVKKTLGFLPEESPLYDYMNVKDYLVFFGSLYGVKKADALVKIDEVLEKLKLVHDGKKIGDFSKGMRRKVAIARSIINDPQVLIYDEPTTGLDPSTKNYIEKFLIEMKEAGKTILFSAHNLHQVEAISDYVLVMKDGKKYVEGTVEELKMKYGHVEYQIKYSINKEVLHETLTDADSLNTLLEKISADGGKVLDVKTREDTLERIFVDMIDGLKTEE